MVVYLPWKGKGWRFDVYVETGNNSHNKICAIPQNRRSDDLFLLW